MARVDADLLDQLLNVSGEVSISRARLEQQMGSIEFNLGELSRTVTRLKEQQRKLEIETEKQILHGHEEETGHRAEFDPLELDRYSAIQQFSRGLAETASDVASIQQLLERMLPPFEHMLRNAVVHGIETPEERVAQGKGDTGTIHLDLQREGAEV